MEDIEGDCELIREFIARHLDGLLDLRGENHLLLVGRFPLRQALNDHPQFAIGDFGFSIRIGGGRCRQEGGEEAEEEEGGFHKGWFTVALRAEGVVKAL